MLKFYSVSYLVGYMPGMHTKQSVKYAEVVKDNIYNALFERPSTMALLDNIEGKDVIDMGCGSGAYAEWFIQQSVNQLTCTDLSNEMVSLVKDKYDSKVRAYVQDIFVGLPLEKNDSADIIVCPLVLHYVEDLTVVFKSVYRVLKTGGYMVFSTHYPLPILSVLSRITILVESALKSGIQLVFQLK